MKSIVSVSAPAPFGPYSQAVASGSLVFCSGQLGVHPQTAVLADGIAAQTEQALVNLLSVLQQERLDFSNVVRCDIFLLNMNDFSVCNEVYARHFTTSPFPARQTVGVHALPKGALVEISCIAVKE